MHYYLDTCSTTTEIWLSFCYNFFFYINKILHWWKGESCSTIALYDGSLNMQHAVKYYSFKTLFDLVFDFESESSHESLISSLSRVTAVSVLWCLFADVDGVVFMGRNSKWPEAAVDRCGAVPCLVWEPESLRRNFRGTRQNQTEGSKPGGGVSSATTAPPGLAMMTNVWRSTVFCALKVLLWERKKCNSSLHLWVRATFEKSTWLIPEFQCALWTTSA